VTRRAHFARPGGRRTRSGPSAAPDTARCRQPRTPPHATAGRSSTRSGRSCATLTDRARYLGSVNVARRNPDGSWHGDQVDGAAFVSAVRAAGGVPEGARALQVGAGGAGSAIALALLEAGVAELALHDADPARRDALIGRLRERVGDRVTAGAPDPAGFDLVANATPMGMRPGDPYPVDVTGLKPDTFVGDVVTKPAVPPLIEVARRVGCRTSTGGDMFATVAGLIADFLLAEGPLRSTR
jgi:shikimate dehydrogenase